MTAAERMLAGARVLVCGTGYTGEDGVELLLAPADAPPLWDELVRRGALPCGLAARDTLRLEACFHLYGHDLSLERGPIEAGLGWCCKEATGFIGADAVRAVRDCRPGRAAGRVRARRPRDRPPREPGRRRGRGDERHALALPWGSGSASPTCPPRARPWAPASRSTSVARFALRSCGRSRCTKAS